MRFRKKPIIVEAEQWFPGKEVAGVTVASEGGKSPDGSTWPPHAFVMTIHGQAANLAPGDWVITEPDGIHHYPHKPEFFEAHYEPVD
jgi:hypothetical protein